MIHGRVPVVLEAESCRSAHEHNSAGQTHTGQLPEWRLGLLEHLVLVLSSFPSKYVSQSRSRTSTLQDPTNIYVFITFGSEGNGTKTSM